MKTYTVVGSAELPRKGPYVSSIHRVAGPFSSKDLAEQAMLAAVHRGWSDVTFTEGEESAHEDKV
jgi:hypothetical protein